MAHTALNGVMALAIWPSNHYHNEILRPSQGSTALVFVINIYFLALLAQINPVDNQNMCYTLHFRKKNGSDGYYNKKHLNCEQLNWITTIILWHLLQQTPQIPNPIIHVWVATESRMEAPHHSRPKVLTPQWGHYNILPLHGVYLFQCKILMS